MARKLDPHSSTPLMARCETVLKELNYFTDAKIASDPSALGVMAKAFSRNLLEIKAIFEMLKDDDLDTVNVAIDFIRDEMYAFLVSGEPLMSEFKNPSGAEPDFERLFGKQRQFGAWRITDPTVLRLNRAYDDDPEKRPRYAFVKARCQECHELSIVRASHLLQGKSLSCCKRGGPKRREVVDAKGEPVEKVDPAELVWE